MKKKLFFILVLLLILLLVFLFFNRNKNLENDNNKINHILVGAAASLTVPLEEIKLNYKNDTGIEIDLQIGGSGALVEQIKNGAPIDIFFSASKKDMMKLESLNLVEDVKYILKNELVFIKSKDSNINLLDKIEKANKIAIGDPDSVPAGSYAKEALKNMRIYDQIKDKIVYAKDVNQVVSWVESGNAEVGFSYFSDTKSHKNIDLVQVIDQQYYSSIIYPIAIIKDSKFKDISKKFIEYLKNEDSIKIFEKYGFIEIK